LGPPTEIAAPENVQEHDDQQPDPDDEQEELQHGQKNLSASEVCCERHSHFLSTPAVIVIPRRGRSALVLRAPVPLWRFRRSKCVGAGRGLRPATVTLGSADWTLTSTSMELPIGACRPPSRTLTEPGIE